MPNLLEDLAAVDLFADLDAKHLKGIAKLVEERSIRDGEEIVREGDYSHYFYVVFSGSADVSVRGKHRGAVGPREFFGELAMLGHTQSATVRAMEPMRLGVIDAKQFYSLLDSEPRIAVHLVESLILRLEEITVRPVGQLV